MLIRLSVSNLAIVERAEVAFGGGLNIITGETGSGKSVLMGALELALGARADASVVRDGAKDARVEAEFAIDDAPGVAAVLDEAGLPECENGALVVRRVISAASGGRVYINDAASTVKTLQALGKALVDLHGPNDHQSLLDESFQRSIIDAYGKVNTAEYQRAWAKLADERERLEALKGDSRDVSAEIDSLRYAVTEIDEAKLTEEDGDDLVARHAAAAHAAEIIEHGNAVTAAVSGEDASAADTLIAVGRELHEMAKYHEVAAEWEDQVESMVVQLQELSRTIDDSISRIDADPDSLQALDDRVSLVQRLKRKYGSTIEEILAARDKKATRLDDLESRDTRIRELAEAIKADEKVVKAVGAKLADARRKAAAKIEKAVTRELHGLGFLQAGFGVEIAAAEPTSSGCDAVDFKFEPNPGEHARSLKDIASSGEIARVMLAIKAVLAEHDSIPVLVFDEIDSNIGGEVGKAVGEKLRAVAAHHQVIAITHLPQSAVFGDHHLVVSKSVSGGRTRTAIREIEGEERVDEIARMLGGAKLTSVVRKHAGELLAMAER